MELNNGLTPSKANKNKRLKFDEQRNLSSASEHNSENDDEDENEKDQKKKDNKFIVGKLQKQIAELTNEVKKLTNIITDMQKEKQTLLEMLQKKKKPTPTKTKKNKFNTSPKNAQNDTQAPKTSVTNTTETTEDTDEKNRDIDMTDLKQNTRTRYTSERNSTKCMTFANALNNNASEPHESEEDDDNDTLSDNDDNEASDFITQKTKRSTKIPPIDIWTDNRAEIQRQILTNINANSCLFGRVNNGKFRVFPNDTETKAKVIDFLNQHKIEYNTYTANNEKMINVLIKGLDHVDEPQTIQEELAAKGFSPIKIQKHTTGYMRKNNIKSNLWLILLQPNTDTKELFKIRSIDHAIIKFEFLKKPVLIQCRRCQRFNHSASNCCLPYRCVKCTDLHEPGQCKSNKNKNKFKPKCVNCQGAHTANDAANCPAFKKAIELKMNKQKKDSNPTNVNRLSITNQSNNVSLKPLTNKSNVSAINGWSVVKNKNKTNNSENESIDKFINHQNKMLNEFMTTMQKMQQKFISNLRS